MSDTIVEIRNRMATLNAELVETTKVLRAKLQEELHKGLKSLFEVHPQVKKVSFSAYTPYFNDGETCEYRVRPEYCQFNGINEDEDEDPEDGAYDVLKNSNPKMYAQVPNPNYTTKKPENEWGNSKTKYAQVPNPNYNPADGKAVSDFREILKQIDTTNWYDIVGDHVTVTITKDGITTEHCEHE